MDRGIGDVGQTEGAQGGQGACPVRRRAQAVRPFQDATVRQAVGRGQRGQAAARAAVAQHLVRPGIHGRVGFQFLPEHHRGVLVFRRRKFRVQRRRGHRRSPRGPALVRRTAVSADRVRPVGPVRADDSLSRGQRGQPELCVRVANRVRCIIRP